LGCLQNFSSSEGGPVKPERVSKDAPASMQLRQFGAQLLAEQVDRDEAAVALDMPERPTVAGRRALHAGADGVDRAAMLGRDQAAVRAHPRGEAAAAVDQHLAGP